MASVPVPALACLVTLTVSLLMPFADAVANGEACVVSSQCDSGLCGNSICREVTTCYPGWREDEIEFCYCPAGFVDTPGDPDNDIADTCEPCPIAQYQDLDNQVACLQCPSGRFSDRNDGVTACQQCMSGRFQSESGQTACDECPHGEKAATTGRSSCDDCEQGRYSSATGASTCTACPKGKYGIATGVSSLDGCVLCSSGHFCEEGELIPCPSGFAAGSTGGEGALDCVACEAGTYSTSGDERCRICTSGYYCPGSTDKIACSRGKFGANTGMMLENEACTQCPKGYFSQASASTHCLLCEMGSYAAVTGQSECLECTHGKFLDRMGATSENLCETCRRGRYCPLGSAWGELCPPGTFSDIRGRTSVGSCKNCPLGQDASLAGATACSNCTVGRYRADESSKFCTSCPDGFAFADDDLTMGSTSDEGCVPCPKGKYAAQFDVHCVGCDLGTYADESGMSSCTNCPDGFFSSSINSTSLAVCEMCAGGSYATAGASACVQCEVGKWSRDASSSCSACEPERQDSDGNCVCGDSEMGQEQTIELQIPPCLDGPFSKHGCSCDVSRSDSPCMYTPCIDSDASNDGDCVDYSWTYCLEVNPSDSCCTSASVHPCCDPFDTSCLFSKRAECVELQEIVDRDYDAWVFYNSSLSAALPEIEANRTAILDEKIANFIQAALLDYVAVHNTTGNLTVADLGDVLPTDEELGVPTLQSFIDDWLGLNGIEVVEEPIPVPECCADDVEQKLWLPLLRSVAYGESYDYEQRYTPFRVGVFEEIAFVWKSGGISCSTNVTTGIGGESLSSEWPWQACAGDNTLMPDAADGTAWGIQLKVNDAFLLEQSEWWALPAECQVPLSNWGAIRCQTPAPFAVYPSSRISLSTRRPDDPTLDVFGDIVVDVFVTVADCEGGPDVTKDPSDVEDLMIVVEERDPDPENPLLRNSRSETDSDLLSPTDYALAADATSDIDIIVRPDGPPLSFIAMTATCFLSIEANDVTLGSSELLISPCDWEGTQNDVTINVNELCGNYDRQQVQGELNALLLASNSSLTVNVPSPSDIQAFAIFIGPTTSVDHRYHSQTVRIYGGVSSSSSGISAQASSSLTSEDGGLVGLVIGVSDSACPTTRSVDDTFITFEVDPPHAAKVVPAEIAVTRFDCEMPRVAYAVGLDDDSYQPDGGTPYTVTVNAAVDGQERASSATISLWNVDNDSPGSTLTRQSVTSSVNELGTQVNMTAALTSKPTTNVTLVLESSDQTEGLPVPARLTFSPDTWNTPMHFAAVGQRDFDATHDDDATDFDIFVASYETTDPSYLVLCVGESASQVSSTDTMSSGSCPSLTLSTLNIVYPIIESVHPEAVVRTGGLLTIYGLNFSPDVTVLIDNVPATVISYRQSRQRRRAQFDAFIDDTYSDVLEVDVPRVSNPLFFQAHYSNITITNDDGGYVENDQVLFRTIDCDGAEGTFGITIHDANSTIVTEDCRDCPSGGFCPGGNRVWPLPGHWNYDEASGWVQPCNAPAIERCSGTRYRLCGAGYEGNFCDFCADGYFRLGSRCEPCDWDDERGVEFFIITATVIILGTLSLLPAYYLQTRSAIALKFFNSMLWTMFQVEVLAVVALAIPPWAEKGTRESAQHLSVALLAFDFLRPECTLSWRLNWINSFVALIVTALILVTPSLIVFTRLYFKSSGLSLRALWVHLMQIFPDIFWNIFCLWRTEKTWRRRKRKEKMRREQEKIMGIATVQEELALRSKRVAWTPVEPWHERTRRYSPRAIDPASLALESDSSDEDKEWLQRKDYKKLQQERQMWEDMSAAQKNALRNLRHVVPDDGLLPGSPYHEVALPTTVARQQPLNVVRKDFTPTMHIRGLMEHTENSQMMHMLEAVGYVPDHAENPSPRIEASLIDDAVAAAGEEADQEFEPARDGEGGSQGGDSSSDDEERKARVSFGFERDGANEEEGEGEVEAEADGKTEAEGEGEEAPPKSFADILGEMKEKEDEKLAEVVEKGEGEKEGEDEEEKKRREKEEWKKFLPEYWSEDQRWYQNNLAHIVVGISRLLFPFVCVLAWRRVNCVSVGNQLVMAWEYETRCGGVSSIWTLLCLVFILYVIGSHLVTFSIWFKDAKFRRTFMSKPRSKPVLSSLFADYSESCEYVAFQETAFVFWLSCATAGGHPHVVLQCSFIYIFAIAHFGCLLSSSLYLKKQRLIKQEKMLARIRSTKALEEAEKEGDAVAEGDDADGQNEEEEGKDQEKDKEEEKEALIPGAKEVQSDDEASNSALNETKFTHEDSDVEALVPRAALLKRKLGSMLSFSNLRKSKKPPEALTKSPKDDESKLTLRQKLKNLSQWHPAPFRSRQQYILRLLCLAAVMIHCTVILLNEEETHSYVDFVLYESTLAIYVLAVLYLSIKRTKDIVKEFLVLSGRVGRRLGTEEDRVTNSEESMEEESDSEESDDSEEESETEESETGTGTGTGTETETETDSIVIPDISSSEEDSDMDEEGEKREDSEHGGEKETNTLSEDPTEEKADAVGKPLPGQEPPEPTPVTEAQEAMVPGEERSKPQEEEGTDTAAAKNRRIRKRRRKRNNENTLGDFRPAFTVVPDETPCEFNFDPYGLTIQHWSHAGALQDGNLAGRIHGQPLIGTWKKEDHRKPVYAWQAGAHRGMRVVGEGKPGPKVPQNMKDGYGEFVWPNGSVYKGEWLGGQRDGWGKCTYANGDTYEGQWSADNKEGEGELRLSNGCVYSGTFAHNGRHGKGRFTSEDPSLGGRCLYDGDWHSDTKFNRGTFFWGDGARYVGQWDDDNLDGVGEFTCPAGKYEGTFASDKRQTVSGTFTWKDGSTYSGSWSNWKADGYGVLKLATGETYDGEWVEGNRHGRGTATMPDGDVYIGSWFMNKRQGQGTHYCKDGRKYVGDWRGNTKSGDGTFYWTDGSTYSGMWAEDKKNGEGVFTRVDGTTYSGEWKDDKKHGKGTNMWLNGDCYVGEFVEDRKEGYGSLTDGSSDEQYKGFWVNEQQHGEGTYLWTNGDMYIGRWMFGRKHGKGTLWFNDNSMYDGYWEADKRHGQGFALWVNGDSYQGGWENDKRQGYGVFTTAPLKEGEEAPVFAGTYSGNWKNDMRDGMGRQVYLDGSFQEGIWAEDKLEQLLESGTVVLDATVPAEFLNDEEEGSSEEEVLVESDDDAKESKKLLK